MGYYYSYPFSAGGELSIAQSLLAELPSQFLSYMQMREILASS